MLKTLPTDWECSVSYGVLHSPESAEHVREFLEAIEEVLDEQLLEGQQSKLSADSKHCIFSVGCHEYVRHEPVLLGVKNMCSMDMHTMNMCSMNI